jgi:hypothetical protein
MLHEKEFYWDGYNRLMHGHLPDRSGLPSILNFSFASDLRGCGSCSLLAFPALCFSLFWLDRCTTPQVDECSFGHICSLITIPFMMETLMTGIF